ncbi:MAG: murein biosynthesis integral membrane protein MurJ [Acidiferrobacterales bacterium]|nr:murein biosynthesis integral membrane protein MurJ [Acidiferrobacterales bacterium]
MSTGEPRESQSQPRGTGKLLKSTAAFGSMTVVSRITGLIRDIVFAQLMGSTYIADAFFVAFRIPNFFRRIFGEGAFSAAFVPVYTQQQATSNQSEVQGFLDLVTGRLAAVLIILSAVGVIFSPLVISILAPGFRGDIDKFQLTVDSLRLTFPYVLFVCLVALSAGILNTHGRFAAPAATPILLNVSLIASALWLTGVTQNAAIALSIGVLGAGVVQFLFQLPFLIGIGKLPRPRLRRKIQGDAEQGAKEVYRLMLPAVFGASVAQVNLIVNTFIASFLITGSVSWLYYSDRLMEFPLGVFGVALGSVILPRLAKEHVDTAYQEFSRVLDWGMRWSLLIGLPSTVALSVLAEEIIATLFFHGAFTQTDVVMSARALVAFSIGLTALIAVRVLSPGFFARNDTKTPVRAGAIAMVVNAILAVVLAIAFQHVGLAAAISIAAFVNAGLLYRWLRRDRVYSPESGWSMFIFRVATASLIMGLALWWLSPGLAFWLDYGVAERVFRLLGYVAIGAALYAISLLALGIRIHQLVKNENR